MSVCLLLFQMMKSLRKSPTLKTALSGIPSTEVLNATLTAYRYLIDPVKHMVDNLPLTGECTVGRAGMSYRWESSIVRVLTWRCVSQLVGDQEIIRARLIKFLKAIVKFCEPYYALQMGDVHTRRTYQLAHPVISMLLKRKFNFARRAGLMGPPPMKRKFSLCEGLGAPARKLAYQPTRLLSNRRWSIRPPRVSSMSIRRATMEASSSLWLSGTPQVSRMPARRANVRVSSSGWPSGRARVHSMAVPRATLGVNSRRVMARPPGVQSATVPRVSPGGCAAESSALRVARPYAVRACYPYRTVL